MAASLIVAMAVSSGWALQQPLHARPARLRVVGAADLHALQAALGERAGEAELGPVAGPVSGGDELGRPVDQGDVAVA